MTTFSSSLDPETSSGGARAPGAGGFVVSSGLRTATSKGGDMRLYFEAFFKSLQAPELTALDSETWDLSVYNKNSNMRCIGSHSLKSQPMLGGRLTPQTPPQPTMSPEVRGTCTRSHTKN